ncbi:MAG: hypothetical protein ACOYOK_02060 [Pseudobdellovibrionaceae bacterium]
MNNKNQKILQIVLSVFAVVVVFGQACSQTPLTSSWESQTSGEVNLASTASTGIITPAATGTDVIGKNNPNIALLTGEQILKSYSQLTDTENENQNSVMNVYNSRRGLFAVENNINLTTSPLLLAATTLAGESCLNLVNKESRSTSGRKFFSSLDFNKGLSAQGDANLKLVYQNFAQNFWARSPNDEEIKIYQDSLKDFTATLSASDLSNARSTRNWALLSCTATLSSFDVLSF